MGEHEGASVAMKAQARRGRSTLVYVAVIAIVLLQTLARLMVVPDKAGNNLLNAQDDLFYYLQIAWNIATKGLVSFDGVTKTNGFHPLWQAVLVPLALVSRPFGRTFFLYATFALISVMTAAVAAGLVFVFRRFVSVEAAGVAALVTIGSTTVFHANGMEATLSLVVAVGGLCYLIRCTEQGRQVSTLALCMFVFLLSASRLELGAAALVIALGLVLTGRTSLRSAAASVGAVAVLFIGIAVFGILTVSSVLPTSTAVKRWWANLDALQRQGSTGLTPGDRYLSHVVHRTLADVGLVPSRVLSSLTFGRRWDQLSLEAWGLLGVSAAFVLALIGMGYVAYRRRDGEGRDVVMLFGVALGPVVLAVNILYSGIAGAGLFRWYLAVPAVVMVGFVVVLILAAAERMVRAPTGRVLLSAVLGLVVIGSLFDVCLQDRRLTEQREYFGDGVVAEAKWVHAHVPKGQRVGGWDAGQLGFYSAREVVNLEGFVSDGKMLDFNRELRVPERLSQLNVHWIVQNFAAEPKESDCDALPPVHLIRRRFLEDYARGFRLVHSFYIAGALRTFFIFKVDYGEIARAAREKMAFERRIAFEAEDIALPSRRASVTLSFPHSSRFAVSGTDLRVPAGSSRQAALFARVSHRPKADNKLFLVADGRTKAVRLPDSPCTWSEVPLPVTRGEVVIRPGPGVFVDAVVRAR